METNNEATQKYWQVRERLMAARVWQLAFFAALDQLDDALGGHGVAVDGNRELDEVTVEALIQEAEALEAEAVELTQEELAGDCADPECFLPVDHQGPCEAGDEPYAVGKNA